jgi:RHS repeat-associated protein
VQVSSRSPSPDERHGGVSSASPPAAKSQPDAPAATSDPGTPGPAKSPVPSISLPKGGGAVRGIGEKFDFNPVTGTGTLSVPLPISPGRCEFGPELSLTYDSGGGNGPFGLGWSLSMPTITRSTDKRLPLYRDEEDSDAFLLSGAEELVPVLYETPNGPWERKTFPRSLNGDEYTVERYRPRVEGLFSRIERWTREDGDVHWRAISRENVTTWYGKTENSRIFDPDDPSRVFSWLACESRDDKGNVLEYEYAEEDSARVDESLPQEANRDDSSRSSSRYPSRIRYGNTVSYLHDSGLAGNRWLFEVVFDYGTEQAANETRGQYFTEQAPDAQERIFATASLSDPREWDIRQDPFSQFRSGFEVRTYRLCRRVLMFHHFPDELGTPDCLVRSLDLEYEESGVLTRLKSATHSGYVRQADGRYLKRSLPPLEVGYSPVELDATVHELDPDSIEDLPEGVDGKRYQWVDLDGEGLSGVLSEQGGGWFYKRNLSPLNTPETNANARTRAQLAPAELVSPRPAATLAEGASFMDLAGDGSTDVVTSGVVAGFYERATDDDTWSPFRPFEFAPPFDREDRNLRFTDLNNDGHPDAVFVSADGVTWHESLAERGHGEARHLPRAAGEEQGPVVLPSEKSQSIHLADMSGDGLTDLVRVRNGEVCYWPNLGHGRFGNKIDMSNAPVFDRTDAFDPERLHFVDIDGSGATDIVYLGVEGVRLHFNQSGNGFADAITLNSFPEVDNLSSVAALDLLGNGTGCLVWSTSLPGSTRRSLRYIDLMSGRKPHLLTKIVNNVGAETHLTYAPSTRFYLADKRAGRPWNTRLPFPVHVLERVDTYDRVSRNRFVSRSAFHHGYFDPEDREFRGFGMVERWDTEEFSSLAESEEFPTGANIDETSHVPPVLTRTWFHTGAFTGGDEIARAYAPEYYREPGLSDDEAEERLLPDTELPPGLDLADAKEACRALKGSMLREETYGLDGSLDEPHPYRVVERSYSLRRLQPREDNEHAVFLTSSNETIDHMYERDPVDPRISHALVLESDEVGQALKTAQVSYGRRVADVDLAPADQVVQATSRVSYSEHIFTNTVSEDDAYRTALPSEATTYELTGYPPSGPANRHMAADFVEPDPAFPGTTRMRGLFDEELDYADAPTNGRQRRPVERVRTLYRKDDLSGPLAPNVLESRGLHYDAYRVSLTPKLVTAVYGTRAPDALLQVAGYVHLQGDSLWWAPAGLTFYSPNASDTPAQELDYARRHFFQPTRYRDPFHSNATSTESVVRFDKYDLLLEETIDPLGNRVTVGERADDPTKPLVSGGNDYRVLGGALTMDENRNVSELRYDALGMVAATATMGKPEDIPANGDKIPAAFNPDPTRAEVDAFVQDPTGQPARDLLGTATTRFVYDVDAFQRDPADRSAELTATIAREQHVSDLPAGQQSRLQVSFAYFDGFGQEIQQKVLTADGPAPRRDENGDVVIGADGLPEMTANPVSPRWITNGWTVFNNKGKPVRKYEPFFSDNHEFEWGATIGVSTISFYDAAERAVGTLLPDHSWQKVVFGPWGTQTWDANDTVRIDDPAADEHIGDFFARLPAHDYAPTWYAAREGGDLGPAEQVAAEKAEVHANTPTLAYFEATGRPFLTVAQNRFKYSDAANPVEEGYETRVKFDIEGNQLELRDARGRLIARYHHDLGGKRIRQDSMEAGTRWLLYDVTGRLLVNWDSLNRRERTTYDALRRPLEGLLRVGNGAEKVVARTEYGEGETNPEVKNLRGRTVRVFDQAGVVTTDDYDFKGNVRRLARRLAQDYKNTLDWSGAVALEAETFVTTTTFNAFDRPSAVTTPDSTLTRPTYNISGQLVSLDANLRGSQQNGQPVWTRFVERIEYDAKNRRSLLELGSGTAPGIAGVISTYEYDPVTSRLRTLVTKRSAASFPDDDSSPPPAGWPGRHIQNISYVYDASGNIVSARDDAQQRIFFRNKKVEPSMEYTYDAVYRLIEASGREHLGGGVAPHSYNDSPRTGIPLSTLDGQAMGRYIERFFYDAVTNIESVRHTGTDPANAGWKREYTYDEPSQLDAADRSNRLTATKIGADTETYSTNGDGYDAHGNSLRLPHLPELQWDSKDQLRMTRRQSLGPGDTEGQQRDGERTWYVYDTGGQRVRKVTESNTGALREERIYVGGYELFRRVGAGGLTRETLHVTDGARRVALVETRTDVANADPLIRYQLGNFLESASVELDHEAKVISYEEYSPYGSTTVQGVRTEVESNKRYRFTGKERDEESGFNYHGGRYYAPWLGRWVSADPAGVSDGPNLYAYVGGSPITRSDPSGHAKQTLGAVGDLILYADSILNRAALGANVQKDHAIAQAIIKSILGPGEKLYHATRELTVAVETGAATATSAAKWHTIKTAQDIRVIQRIRALLAADEAAIAGGGVAKGLSLTKDVLPLVEQSLVTANGGAPLTGRQGTAILSQLGNLFSTTTAEQAGKLLALHEAGDAAKFSATVDKLAKSTQGVTRWNRVLRSIASTENLAAAAAKGAAVLSKAAPYVAKLAPAAKWLGRVAGPLGIAAGGLQIATAKNTEQKIDGGITVVSSTLMMSKHPVAMAAGGGLFVGQQLDKSLKVSDYSSEAGVYVYEKLKEKGVNDTAAFVVGGVASVAAIVPAIGYGAAAKVSSWFK